MKPSPYVLSLLVSDDYSPETILRDTTGGSGVDRRWGVLF
jgi:hypothetical protein